MKDRLFLDTNVLVYLADENSPFFKKTNDLYESLSRKYEFWICRQVLREYAVIVSRPDFTTIQLSSKQIVEDLNSWENNLYVADETIEVTNKLKDLIELYGIRGKRIHDTNIVATMIENRIKFLFTYNINDFKHFKEIEIIEINKDHS
ncbi:MAG: type II toxin-antitoxin system VapC family toxin [Spirochaetales bacterium]|nr:type II toxin-antitoxin system VapC family toxin [Spirochaetales bacterium]